MGNSWGSKVGTAAYRKLRREKDHLVPEPRRFSYSDFLQEFSGTFFGETGISSALSPAN
jgi:hypothetical protein